MSSISMLSVLENLHVSPTPDTISDSTSLPMTFMDIQHILTPPPHTALFFKLPLTKAEFIASIVPKLKHSLSITLGHFLPFAGNLIVYATNTTMPEILYVEGDYVKVTIAECNLDFNDLTGYHPRNCDKFYHLIPLLGNYVKTSNYVKIPVLSLQVTLFPNSGFSLVVTSHHCLTDASTLFCFMNAWASIAKCGSDESFLANGNLPFFGRVVVNDPERDKSSLMMAKVETLFDKEYYQPPKLSGPSDKVRGSFVLTRTFIDQLKNSVSTILPTLPYVSSFTVICAHIWCCLAKTFNEDGRQGFMFGVDARRRLDPPIPTSYVGNCIVDNMTIAKGTLLTGNEGFVTAAKLIGENLHKMLTGKHDILANKLIGEKLHEMATDKDGWPKRLVVVAGTPKVRYYDLDFGWGKPEKLEKLTLDHFFVYGGLAVSMDGGKLNQDVEIGVRLTATQMETFAFEFNKAPEA
uniref:malonyl-coenzyme A:anthocyanin 3-O-glucoside-6''-O-malonyltransferase-like n=1 Tax=Erigeron canadensis TaxID=72917 RepID=UPI001CB8FA0F|nr:malonyl-coenzyme A:anthocyanin 3-O-glucoside-6''-O-malonyltransferase-like [Erigeron canadensis]